MNFSLRKLKLEITTLVLVIILFNCLPSTKVSAQDTILQLFEDIRIQIVQSDIHKGSKTALLARLSVAEAFYTRGKYDQSINHLDRLREWVIHMTPKHVPEMTSLEITQELEYLTQEILNLVLIFVDIGVTTPWDNTLDSSSTVVSMAESDINQYSVENNLPYRFKFHLVSNQGSDDTALQNTIDFHEQGINLVVGHGWSSQCYASLDYVNENNMLLLSSSSTWTELAIPDKLYRLTPNDFAQAHVIAKLHEQQGTQGMVIYYLDDDSWSIGLSQAIKDQCTMLGIQILAMIPYDPDNWDIGSDLTYMDNLLLDSELDPESLAVQVVSFFEVYEIIRTLDENPYQIIGDLHWFGTDGNNDNQDFLYDFTDTTTQIKLYSPIVALIEDDPLYIDFNNRYNQFMGSDASFYTSSFYDCMWIYAKSVIDAKGTDTMKVKSSMEDLVQDYHGVSGYSTFDINGDRKGANYDIRGFGWSAGEPDLLVYGQYDEFTDSIIWYNLVD